MEKHTYIMNKKFIFCVFGEDEDFFYGEILYGNKPIRQKVKTIRVDGIRYYRYWQLENRERGGSYLEYLKSVKKIFRSYYFNHPIMGKLFRLSKKSDFHILHLKKMVDCPKISLLAEGLSKLFHISVQSIYISGSFLLGPSIKTGDFDVIIEGLSNNKIFSKKLDSIVASQRYKLLSGGHAHQRRFMFKKKIICPFGISRTISFENLEFKKMSCKKITAEVIDSSLSLLSPAVYEIKIGHKKVLLISYHVGHSHLLRVGDKISFNTEFFQFFMGKKRTRAFVIPIEGSWITIY